VKDIRQKMKVINLHNKTAEEIFINTKFDHGNCNAMNIIMQNNIILSLSINLSRSPTIPALQAGDCKSRSHSFERGCL
jgi:hypothetical protein